MYFVVPRYGLIQVTSKYTKRHEKIRYRNLKSAKKVVTLEVGTFLLSCHFVYFVVPNYWRIVSNHEFRRLLPSILNSPLVLGVAGHTLQRISQRTSLPVPGDRRSTANLADHGPYTNRSFFGTRPLVSSCKDRILLRELRARCTTILNDRGPRSCSLCHDCVRYGRFPWVQ